MFHSNFFPPASTSDFIACKRLPLGRAKERFFLDNPYDSFNWLFAARDFVFCSLGRLYRCLQPCHACHRWVGGFQSILSTPPHQTRNCPGNVLSTFWSRRASFPLIAARSF